ncbi:MAG TPA: alkaline phosphatase family protein [Ghiorsea sp.]|nr:alkaline phosphatase family protein [Ghiorsea sp.]
MMLKRWFFSVLFLSLVTLSYRLSFVLYHQEVFTSHTWSEQLYALLWGLRFDVAFVLPMALLSLLLYLIVKLLFSKSVQHIAYAWFVLPWIVLMWLVQTGDALYFQDAGRHIGYEILAAQGDAPNLLQHALNTGLTLVIANAVLCLLFVMLSFVCLRRADETTHISRKIQHGFTLFLILLVTVVGVRGGISGVPQSPVQVHQVGDSKQAIIAANPVYIAFFILSSQGKPLTQVMLPESSLSAEETIAFLYPELRQEEPKQALPYNVIFILLESWNAAFMPSYNAAAKHQVTPNFDAFRARAISADMTLAGGHRTTEGMFTSMCSLQNPLGSSLVNTQLMDLTYRCLPQILKDEGYVTSFIQGSYRDTSSVGSFAQKLGFAESLGKVELPRGKLAHNAWGLHDDDLYEYLFAKTLAQKQPFFFALNTNSTHDTVLPLHVSPLLNEDVQDAKHKNAMHYADAALGRFITKFEQSPLANNTLIVLVADHTAQVRGSDLYEYMVPMAISIPNRGAKNISFATSQRDIAPTILDALHLPPSRSFTGKSLLSAKVFFADYFHHQHLGWMEGDDLVRINVLTGETTCFAWRQDLQLKHPQRCEGKERVRQHALGFTHWAQQALFAGETGRLRQRLSQ